MDGGANEKWLLAMRDLIVENKLHHTFWCVNPNSGDTGGLLKNDWLTWDEEKYALFEPTLWKTPEGKYIGLDHQVVLGNQEMGTNVAEYYKSLSAFVDISSPEPGKFVLVGSDVLLKLSRNKLTGVNAYINGERVASSETNEIVVSSTATEQSFTITLIGTNADGSETSVSNQITLNAVTKFMPELTVSVPENVEQMRSFDVSVDVEHAAGYKAEFEGQTKFVLDNTDSQFTAPQAVGSYSLVITAIGENNVPHGESETLTIDVVPLTIACSVVGESVWNSGAVLSDVKVSNIGDESIHAWEILLSFENEVQFSNGWNANFEQIDSNIIQVSSMRALGVKEYHSFGLQMSHNGTFGTPKCVAK